MITLQEHSNTESDTTQEHWFTWRPSQKCSGKAKYL